MRYQHVCLVFAVLAPGLVRPLAALDERSGSTTAAAVNGTGYKLIGWNDLGMHCMDGQDYSVFAVLPPYNTIHAHLLDPNGKVIHSGFAVTYQGVTDPFSNTINTTSSPKTNFWAYAAKLGFGILAPEMGLKGFAMPGAANTPQSMAFSTADNTFLAEGIPVTPWGDAAGAPYPWNPFPMLQLVAKNASGAVVASTKIVVPVSNEMTCAVCHSSAAATLAAQPVSGWVNETDPLKDVKLNILRKHDDRFKSASLYQTAATQFGYNTKGLEATARTTGPVLCATCHASNALGTAGVPGIPPLTAGMHGAHAGVVDPQTGQTLDSSTARDSCYRCHPGPSTRCLRGAMSTAGVQCQNCHGNMTALASTNRQGWLDEPACQSCHTGTATRNNGQIVYSSVFNGINTVRQAVDQTFATNPNTPKAGLSLYRFSAGHGGLQCEACHGSTHAEYATTIVNDNMQSNALQGHVGTIAECTACHSSVPSTITGGPHGLHPLGQAWVGGHQSAAESNRTRCQACHGADYRGTILSKAQADRRLNAGEYGTKTFARGTIVGCYSCHNGPNP